MVPMSVNARLGRQDVFLYLLSVLTGFNLREKRISEARFGMAKCRAVSRVGYAVSLFPTSLSTSEVTTATAKMFQGRGTVY